MTDNVNINSTRQLFLDDHVVDSMEGVQRRYHRPVRPIDRPVVDADLPWEQGPGPFLFGGTVIFDEEDRIFKMWYRTSERLERAPGGWQEVVSEDGTTSRISYVAGPGHWRACYATSQDGLTWDRPDLGIEEYNGSRNNNILPSGTGEKSIIRRPALIKDYEEPDPARRYKMAYVDQIGGEWYLAQAYSADGVRWNMGAGIPAHFEQPILPHGAFFGWDPVNDAWIHYSKKSGKRRLDVDGRTTGGLSIYRSTSPDFEHWGDTREVIARQDTDPQFWAPGSHAILSALLYTDDLFIGVSDTAPSSSPEGGSAGHFTELFYSRDGVDWRRASKFFEFLRPGLLGTWDSEFVVCSKPLVHDDEVYFYYSGNSLNCNAHTPDHPQNHLLGTEANGVKFGYGVGLAKMRLDGFVSIDGYEPSGALTTKPLVFEGDRIAVNARAPEKAHRDVRNAPTPYGALKVELLTDKGDLLAGYSADDCDPFVGDDLRHTVTWNGNGDLGRLSGRPVRARFHLRNAALYSFHFRSENEPRGLANPGEPGSRGWPV